MFCVLERPKVFDLHLSINLQHLQAFTSHQPLMSICRNVEWP